jgi:hypothetical protein
MVYSSLLINDNGILPPGWQFLTIVKDTASDFDAPFAN